MKQGNSSVAHKWRENLKMGGYEHHISKRGNCKKLKKFSRLWKRIFKFINLDYFLNSKKNLRIFEVGCGGAKHLVMFALNGWACIGLDCSEEVLRRAKNYINDIANLCNKELNIDLICSDFLDYAPGDNSKFDIVFSVGVVEHFLDENERMKVLKKMFNLVDSGGYLITIVPNGTQPLREEMREKRLGGYDIPEIDYSPEIFKKELKECSDVNIDVFGHNIFNYIFLKRGKFKFFKKIFYLAWQVIPLSILPKKFVYRHSDTLIGIAKKP